ncbi:hypothetical protein L1987_58142 [Smallanthus sonchifolius]|uniref:Uncharacterized protein n=1 Tax=Smallanthus sonchifolius TaxID=185202 RepID=A0ACB9DEP4_9ASTR|nr:hypothetical protein L1987_58142 [Smallanthus sonchifolius]
MIRNLRLRRSGFSGCKAGFKRSTGTSSMSYRDVVSEDRNKRHEGKSVTISDEVMAFSDLHGKAIMARLKDLDALHRIRETLADMDIGVYKVQYMGGLMVLISFTYEISEVGFKEEAMKRLDAFDTVWVWEGQSVPFERLARLRIQGAPLNILENSVLDTIGGLFGKVIHRAHLQKSDEDISYVNVGVLVGHGRKIDEEVTVSWRQKKLKVWVLDEAGERFPDLLDQFSDETSTDSDKSGEDTVVEQMDCLNKEDDTVQIPVKGLGSSPGSSTVNRPISDTSIGQELPSEDPLISANHGDISNNVERYPDLGHVPNLHGSTKILEKEKENNEEMEKSDLQILKEKSLGRIESSNMCDVDCSKMEPGGIQGEEMFVEDDSRPSEILAIPEDRRETQNAQGVPTDCVNQEVRKTVSLGVMLGAQLQNFQDMVREAVHQEGLQLGKR